MCERIKPDGLDEPLPFHTLYNYDDTFTKYKQISVDCCLVPLITTLHSQGIRTFGSCCGHHRYCGSVTIDPRAYEEAKNLGYKINHRRGADPRTKISYHIYKIERFNDSCRKCEWEGCPCTCHEK